jgi:hypothetical protein
MASNVLNNARVGINQVRDGRIAFLNFDFCACAAVGDVVLGKFMALRGVRRRSLEVKHCCRYAHNIMMQWNNVALMRALC